MTYTKKQIKALKVFVEYITTERPYEEMDYESYSCLYKMFELLPTCVFTTRKIKNLYHFRYDAGEQISSSSGIVSCTTKQGIEHILDEWCKGEKSKVFETSTPIRVVCVRKLLRLYIRIVGGIGEKVVDRVNKEKEYIILLKDFNTTGVRNFVK